MKGFTSLVLMCFGVAGFLFSCTNPLKEERRSILPADSIISEQVMVELIADIHILEAGLLQKRTTARKRQGLPRNGTGDFLRNMGSRIPGSGKT